ncbi:aminotransferase class V-fold PLP-dependent enzyme [bacterium]|nr:aminotransferase class V-fold PLP-dependent enzyme [bacterium]
MKVYFDNAATTPVDERVIELMTRVLQENYGNPSSIHSHGRKSRTLIEKSRKKVANALGVAPGEIFFTSGGTEADNMALTCAVTDLECKHIITSPLEHHAVLHTAEHIEKCYKDVKLSYVGLTPNGHIDTEDLRRLLQENSHLKTMVSLMHANNEIGNMIDLAEIGEICAEHQAYFHTDTVQTIGHWEVKPKENKVHFLAASAHKFNGPKGVGFIYIDENVQVKPFIHGGAQERNMRGGTENLAGIVGLAKALEISLDEMEEMKNRIMGLRAHMIKRLTTEVEGVSFNGDYNGRSNYIPLNIAFPNHKDSDMLLFNLDIAGISASGGSACSSGSNIGSHVLKAINADPDKTSVRFSFGKYNTLEEIDYTVDKLVEILSDRKIAVA